MFKNIWVVDRTGEGWSEPSFLGPPLNDMIPVYLSFENDGTVYFTNMFPHEIRSAKMSDGRFIGFTILPDAINGLREVAHPAVAPDGSYIIVDSIYEENDRLAGSMYNSYRRVDGSWSAAVSMKEALKASDSDMYATARVTPDGRYIFFEKYDPDTDKADIYWVDAKVVEALRPES